MFKLCSFVDSCIFSCYDAWEKHSLVWSLEGLHACGIPTTVINIGTIISSNWCYDIISFQDSEGPSMLLLPHLYRGFVTHFTSLGRRRKRRKGLRAIWSHNLLEIYPSEINFISSHTQSQLNLCPATLRVTVIPCEGHWIEWSSNSRAIKL